MSIRTKGFKSNTNTSVSETDGQPPAPEPLIAPTGNMTLDGMTDVINQTASGFQNAPPPEQGTVGEISQNVNAVMGAVGAPFMMLDTGFAMATSGLAAIMPGFPAATLTAPHLGMSHGHMHPPSLTPPATVPVPLPSIGMTAASGSTSVLIGGIPAARACDLGPAPTCGSLSPMFEIFTGSSNTFIGGSRASRLSDMTRHCNPASALGLLGAAMGAAGLAAGGLSAGATESGGETEAAVMQAAQVAADAVALALAAFLGKDPGVPPAMGVVMSGNPTVLIGGFPMPDLLELLGGLIKFVKKLKKKKKPKIEFGGESSKTKPQKCLDPNEPVSVVTGEVYNDFTDAKIDPETDWKWARHYRSGWSDEPSPIGRGFRHFYDKRLQLRRRSAVFHDYNGVEIDFARDRHSLIYGGIAFGYKLVQRDLVNFEIETPHAAKYLFRRPQPNSEQALLVAIQQPNQPIILLQYHRNGPLAGMKRQSINAALEIQLIYDRNDCIIEVRKLSHDKALVTLAQYNYDNQGCLSVFRNAYGAEYRYFYEAGKMTRAEDSRGYGFIWKYNYLGQCIESRGDDDLLGGTLIYEIGRTIVTEADGGVWTYTYNDDGIITRITDPCGGFKQYRTNEEGLICEQTDATGQVTKWLYDSNGYHYGRLDPWGNLVPPENDDMYPATGRELRIPEHPQAMQLGTAEINVPSAPNFTGFDFVVIPAQLRKQARACLPAVPQQPEIKQTIYDSKGNCVMQCDAWGYEEHYKFSPQAEPVATVDADGRRTRRDYGSWELVMRSIDPNNAVTQYSYDHRQQINVIKDPRGHLVQYQRDLCGRIEKIFNEGELEERYEHDIAGRVITTFDGDNNPLVHYTYGENGLCKTRTQTSGEEHKYSYDAQGNICEASTKEIDVRLAYNSDRCVILDKRDGRGIEHRSLGNHDRFSLLFDKFETRYEQDINGFTRITTPDGKQHRLRFLPDGYAERSHNNGLHELSHYDGKGRCSGRYLWRDGHRDQPLWYARYIYSHAGDLQQAEDSIGGTTHFTYDAGHRVTGMRNGHGQPITLSYDSAGNILQNQFHAWLRCDQRNQLVEGAGETFVYNRRYHLAEHRRYNGVTTSYHYNSLDRLVRVSWSDGRPDWQAAYDGFGRRLYKEQDGKRTEYYWDDHRLAAEISPDGALRVYIYPTPDALLPILFIDYDSVDAEPDSGRAYTVFTDQVGLPTLICDRDDRVVWRTRQADPYGYLDLDKYNQITYNLRYPGHYYDPELDLHYNRFRYYDPRLGRYLQSDPMGQAGGVNVYAYPANPFIGVDVLGLVGHDPKGKTNSDGNVTDNTGPKKKGTDSLGDINDGPKTTTAKTKPDAPEAIPDQEITKYDTPHKPLSPQKRADLKEKLDNRTITRDEYQQLEWDRKFSNRRNRGVSRFWAQERRKLRAGEPGTRNWSPEQRDAILKGKRPKFDGDTLEGHHKHNALDHPQIADDPQNIYPATKKEHLERWHGGNFQNDTVGKPLKPNALEEF